MTGGRPGARWIGTAVLLALLAGCGAFQRNTDPPLESFSAEDIYKKGEYELAAQRKPGDAIRYFSEVERLYP